MGLSLSHVKKRMAIIKSRNNRYELLVSRNTKDGKTVSIKVHNFPPKWAVFKTEDIMMGLLYVTNTDEELRSINGT